MGSGVVFEPMACRICGRPVVPSSQSPTGPATPKTAIYVCSCGWRYSHGRNVEARTAFAPSPELNVPERYRPQLEETLAAAANIGNRTSKRSKFTYSTSEDAVTWTIFRWLEAEGGLSVVAEAAGVVAPAGKPEVLFWGAPVGGQLTPLSQQLREISLGVDGKPDRLSEPDVVLAWRDAIFFVEVKYQAPNERKRDYPHFERYTSGPNAEGLFARPPDVVAAAGWYELTRNWRIGSELAQARGADFTLVNLAPRTRREEANLFEPAIAPTAHRRFAFVSWLELLTLARKKTTTPAEVDSFIAERELEGRWG